MSVSQTCCTHTHKWADSRATQYPEQTCHPLSQKLWLRSINSKHRTVQYINETVQTSHDQGRYFTHTQTPTVSQLDSVGIVCNLSSSECSTLPTYRKCPMSQTAMCFGWTLILSKASYTICMHNYKHNPKYKNIECIWIQFQSAKII